MVSSVSKLLNINSYHFLTLGFLILSAIHAITNPQSAKLPSIVHITFELIAAKTVIIYILIYLLYQI